jgi:hypothetical protein
VSSYNARRKLADEAKAKLKTVKKQTGGAEAGLAG